MSIIQCWGGIVTNIELPDSSQALLLQIGRAHLAYNYVIAFDEKAPEEIFTRDLVVKAASDWRNFRAHGLVLLVALAARTRSILAQRGHQAAVRFFTQHVTDNTDISMTIRTPPYLHQLINAHIDDAEEFDKLLDLIQQLVKPTR